MPFQTITKIPERHKTKRSGISIVLDVIFLSITTKHLSFVFSYIYCSCFTRLHSLKMNYFYENSSKNVFLDRNHL